MAISKVVAVENKTSSKVTVHNYTLIIFLTIALVLSGCHKPVEPSFEDISRIKKVGVCVRVERGFAVRLQYISNADQNFFGNLMSAGLAGGFIGMGLAVFSEFSPDKEFTRELRPDAVQMDNAEAIGYVLVNKFRTAGGFPTVELVQSQSVRKIQESRIDTFLYFTIRRWGLRPPLGSEYDIHKTGDKALATLELDINLKLVSSDTKKVLWERDEFYVDSQSYTLNDFKSQKELLVSRLDHALQLVCNWTANELSIIRQNPRLIQ
jgi:hypothetical protein